MYMLFIYNINIGIVYIYIIYIYIIYTYIKHNRLPISMRSIYIMI